jgi:hypothetical protein
MLAMEFYKTKVNNGNAIAYLGTKASAHYIESIGLKTIPVREVDFNNLDHHRIICFS